ncbi:hypothetical protein D3C76_1631350 [compost metagenome]
MKIFPTRFFGPMVAVKRSGSWLAMNSASALPKALTQFQSARRASGTTRCMPLPPLVLR